MEEERDKLEKMYQKLNEEEDLILRKWNESLIPKTCLLYTSPSPRDRTRSRMPSSA